jgi:soluble lytic murein transglycosylase
VKRIFAFIVLLAAMSAGALYYWAEQTKAVQTQYDSLIEPVAEQEGIDPKLIRAVIWRESRFDPTAKGQAQERGLMQVTPVAGLEWAKHYKVENFVETDLFSPDTNIRAGTWYLARSLKRWNDTDDPVVFALAEYNAGRTHALRWVDPLAPHSEVAFLARIDFSSTKRYVLAIKKKHGEYLRDYFEPPWKLWLDRLNRKLTQKFDS